MCSRASIENADGLPGINMCPTPGIRGDRNRAITVMLNSSTSSPDRFTHVCRTRKFELQHPVTYRFTIICYMNNAIKARIPVHLRSKKNRAYVTKLVETVDFLTVDLAMVSW